MKHPPYHLRPNKAIDRFMLMETIRHLEKRCSLSRYTYYSLGGPYLEDFRILYEHCPDVAMTSVESDHETVKRQKLHLPCRHLKLIEAPFKSFLAKYDSRNRKSIFWLDYIDLSYSAIDEFMQLLTKVADDSVVKITLRAQPTDYSDPDPKREAEKLERFRSEFDVLLDPDCELPAGLEDFAYLVQGMLQIASQKALPSVTGRVFQPLSSFCYADGVGIVTLTGVVCPKRSQEQFRSLFSKWQFRNLNWHRPSRIDVPILSTRERLQLQEHLPCCAGKAGIRLSAVLGYLVDETRQKSWRKMSQYALFHRYSPYFVRAVP